MEGGEEVWTTDKEARGRTWILWWGRRVSSDLSHTDKVYIEMYKPYVVTKIPACSCVSWCTKLCVYIYKHVR